jgi:phospholipid/cholesterol/gamma-HCH transport system substrate-binding protein
MTIAPPAPPEAPPPVAPVPSAQRGPQPVPRKTRRKTRRYAWWGALAVAIALAAGVLVFASFGGEFSNFVAVTAALPASSTAVALNSPVEYKNVQVGTVVSQGTSIPGGLISITLHIEPSMVHSIPANVRVTVAPVSFFGNEYVVLVPPAHPDKTTLRAHQQIEPLVTGQTASLQALLSNLDHLLIELHPGQLDAALTALSSALVGQGTSLGKNLVAGNKYLEAMLPLWPKVVADLEATEPVANSFAEATPNLLQILSNQTITSKTITDSASNVRNAISGGETIASDANKLFDAIQSPFAVLTADSVPFLQDLSQNPDEIAELLTGLDKFANAFMAAEANGPYLSVTANINVINPADLGVAVLGGSSSTLIKAISAGLGPSYVNPPLYTAADCPHFGSLSDCDGVATGGSTNLDSAVLPAAAETEAVSQIYQSVSGRAPANSSVSSLLLSPVLEGLVARS